METYVTFLRGINVSGSNLIKMETLRNILCRKGLSDVQTYIQSGNLVFHSELLPENRIEQKISELIQEHFGITVPVFVLNICELRKIQELNPFLTHENQPEEFLHLTILKESVPMLESEDQFHLMEDGVEKAKIAGKNIFLYLPAGYGNAKFTNAFFEKKFKMPATTRNWRTIKKMLSLADSL